MLDDPRALSTLDLHPANAPPDLGLGPEPDDPALTPASLHALLAKKRGPIKPVLLDQRVIAGLGNIYAAESLWHARISPVARAASLSPKQVATLLAAIRRVIDARRGRRRAIHRLVGVEIRRVRSRGEAVSAVSDADRANRSSGAIDLLLSVLSAGNNSGRSRR